MENHDHEWDIVLKPKVSLFKLNLQDVWRYRDLLFLLVKRDYVASFKQTILGPLWFFIQPILTTLVFVVIFGKVAKLGPDNMPVMLFYLSGVILWNYFSNSLTATASTFVSNASIFGKVYFPRLIMPLSVIISNLLKFAVQFVFFIIVYIYYLATNQIELHFNLATLLFPVTILMMAILGLSFGLLISSLTTKYRDLTHLLTFGVQLLMYITPVILPASRFQGTFRYLLELNPMTGYIEAFRYAFVGSDFFSWPLFGYSLGVTIVLFFLAAMTFNNVEKSFMDTV